MQNTSSEYKELVKQSGRTFKAKVICTFADGTQKIFTDSDIMQNGLKISDATSNEGSFDVGCAIIKELVLELDNSNKQLADIDFSNAKFDVRIGLVIEQKYDGTTKTEWIKKGIYYTEEITENENFVSIVAYDAMAKFDKPYNSSLKFPQMLLSIFSDACTACGVPYASLAFPNSKFYVQSKDFINENTTYRDIISYVAQLACCFVRVDVDGIVHMRWYEDTNREIIERQKISGNVTVTCALITTADEESKTYIIGHRGYAVNIEDNPLAQGSVNSLATAFSDNILEKTITPFEGEVFSDPSIEAGDIVTIYDYSGNDYKTYITSVTFNIDNKMQIACDAETFNEKNRAGGSQSATIIAMAKKQTEMQISEYDIRVQQMNQLATNAMGYYETIETQDDGSIICYMHDKENLSDSKTIWKKTVDGIFISSDGGKTYIAGVDKNGNAVLKILATEGIVADWINAGTLNANLIKSGTLNGNTIKTDTLSGEAIKTGTLDGDTIKANTLNGNTIIAGTLNGNAIKTGTLDAGQISSGSIDAGMIKTGTIKSSGTNPTSLNLSTGEFISSNTDGSYKLRIINGKIYVTAGGGKEFLLVTSNAGKASLKIESIEYTGSIDSAGSDTSIAGKTVYTNTLKAAGSEELNIESPKIDGHTIVFNTRTLSDGTTLKYLSWE